MALQKGGVVQSYNLIDLNSLNEKEAKKEEEKQKRKMRKKMKKKSVLENVNSKKNNTNDENENDISNDKMKQYVLERYYMDLEEELNKEDEEQNAIIEEKQADDLLDF